MYVEGPRGYLWKIDSKLQLIDSVEPLHIKPGVAASLFILVTN